MDQKNVQDLAEKWLSWDKTDSTRREIQNLLDDANFEELEKRLCGSLTFGTAGVRTRMEAGFTRLNDLTILQLSHGFARHLCDTIESKRGIVIGYDGRHNSKRFAQLASNVFIQNDIPVYLFRNYVPTPVVSFAVVELNCDAGLMITASHNPKEDNGYKAYWSNGAQILAPHDVEICRIVKNEPEPKLDYWNTQIMETSPLLHTIDALMDRYFVNESSVCCYQKELNRKSPVRITYSAFHGVGSVFARRMFEVFNFPAENFSFVKEQDEPNPDFPTVKFPNPEEGHRVLELCFKTATANNATVILANDPDADRLQLAEKQPDGQWRVFSGNEMGALLTWWVWTNFQQRNPQVVASNVYVLNSAVSSQIVATMAKMEGFKNDVSLTGFKWIGNLAHKLRSEGKIVILAWEESIGFTPGTTLDKDGVSAAAVFVEMATWLQLQPTPLSLQQQLYRLYNKYGFHLVRSSYWIVPSPDVTKALFAQLRANYPPQLGQSGKIQYVRDLTTGFDNSQPDNKAVLPLSTSSEMVTFTLDNGNIATLRASGTEPKIKYYIELRTEPGKTEKDLSGVMSALDKLEVDVVQTLLQPDKYKLFERK